MTINEIETTLHTLEARHPTLDEAMLVTLLTAGGWDDASIKDAVALFRKGTYKENQVQKTVQETSSPAQILPIMVDIDHRILEHNPEDVIVENKKITEGVHSTQEIIKIEEPQSLIEPIEVLPMRSHEDELPHNLPLRPFESTTHVWPFSRYKDVFHGEVMPTKALEQDKKPRGRLEIREPEAESKIEIQKPIEKEVIRERVIETQKIIEKHVVVDHVHLERTPLTGKDEKLIVLASTMLLAVLLLLGYMYSNGRL
jgi:hypothetical protein